jgi:hypothetical protein
MLRGMILASPADFGDGAEAIALVDALRATCRTPATASACGFAPSGRVPSESALGD